MNSRLRQTQENEAGGSGGKEGGIISMHRFEPQFDFASTEEARSHFPEFLRPHTSHGWEMVRSIHAVGITRRWARFTLDFCRMNVGWEIYGWYDPCRRVIAGGEDARLIHDE